MLLNMLKSKIHRATVTEADINYVGSITVDVDLLKAAGILPGEKVQVVNINNGARFSTYTMEGPAQSGVICLNGPAARLAQPGDKIIIITYCWLEADEIHAFNPTIIFVDEKNRRITLPDYPQPGVTVA